MTTRWHIDMSWLVGVAFFAAIAVGFKSCSDSQDYSVQASIYQDCLRAASRNANIKCEAPKP